jgi:hypothetical protein
MHHYSRPSLQGTDMVNLLLRMKQSYGRARLPLRKNIFIFGFAKGFLPDDEKALG